MAAQVAAVPRRVLARWRSAMALMGLGSGAAVAGLGWDFYVHEIAKEVAAVESMFAAPHLLIFAGIGISALGFLIALAGIRFRAAPQERPSLAADL